MVGRLSEPSEFGCGCSPVWCGYPPPVRIAGDMTILIAALDRGNAILAADGKVTDKEGRSMTETQQKIVPVTRDIAFGVSGNATVGLAALHAVLRSELPLTADFFEEWTGSEYPIRFAKWGLLKDKVTKELQSAISRWPMAFIEKNDPVIVMCGRVKGTGKISVWHINERWKPVEFVADTFAPQLFLPHGMPQDQEDAVAGLLHSPGEIMQRIRNAVRKCAESEEQREFPRTNRHLAILDWNAGLKLQWEDV
jgi:hypothetical protein